MYCYAETSQENPQGISKSKNGGQHQSFDYTTIAAMLNFFDRTLWTEQANMEGNTICLYVLGLGEIFCAWCIFIYMQVCMYVFLFMFLHAQ